MSKKLINARDLHDKWMKEPGYRKAYDELDEEFRLASALIEARARAGLTQEQLART
jgi:DNA-binding XRE family transcriptional regulator